MDVREHHADRAAAIADELARNLRSRKEPRFGDRVITEALEVSLPVLTTHLRAAAEPRLPDLVLRVLLDLWMSEDNTDPTWNQYQNTEARRTAVAELLEAEATRRGTDVVGLFHTHRPEGER